MSCKFTLANWQAWSELTLIGWYDVGVQFKLMNRLPLDRHANLHIFMYANDQTPNFILLLTPNLELITSIGFGWFYEQFNTISFYLVVNDMVWMSYFSWMEYTKEHQRWTLPDTVLFGMSLEPHSLGFSIILWRIDCVMGKWESGDSLSLQILWEPMRWGMNLENLEVISNVDYIWHLQHMMPPWNIVERPKILWIQQMYFLTMI